MSSAAASSAPPTILIVDDIPTNLAVVVEQLEARNFRVLVAQDGEEGLRRAALALPDLILLDVMMPGPNGFEICRRLKALARTRDIPVIFMTSLADVHDKITGFSVGGADYVTRPLQVEEVMARVDVQLRLRTLQLRLQTQNAELASANEELQAFSYSVSHDLRAPLRAIEGFAQILRGEHSHEFSGESLHFLDRIIVCGHRMDMLIKDLLQYAQTGRAAVRAVPVLLAPIAQQLALTFSERIASSGARFEVASPLATPLGDPTLIGQILSNLVDNALTYRSSEGTPQVRLSATRVGGQVVLRVADNGIGIEPAYHGRIFQVFQRLHGVEEFPGTGIGLAIVAKSARLMEGTVSVESAPGQGSTFSVFLPTADIEQVAS